MIEDIQIIDNFIPEQFQSHIENTLTDPLFPYYFNQKTVQDNHTDYDVPQFTHTFFKENTNSQWWSEIKPMLYFLEEKIELKTTEIVRAKANFLFKHWNNSPHPLHRDIKNSDYFSLIYYVNDSDGDTYFYQDFSKCITPKKGRAVFFRSNILHTSSSPVDSEHRIIINFIGKFSK